MGVTITATNSTYTFDMGCGGFFNLRKNIALALDKEFGENYALLGKCITERQFKENDKNAEIIITKNNLYKSHKDIIDFLYMSDCDGKVSYKTCKQIYEIIKDIDFGDKGFRYAKYSKNDYEEFKEFLKECYSKHRNMRWF